MPRRHAPSKAVARTRRQRARVEVPAVRREEPRPAEHLAGVDRLDRRSRRVPARRVSSATLPVADDVERVRRLALAEEHARPASKRTLRGAAGEQRELVGARARRGTARRRGRASSARSIVSLRRADRRDLLGDVDADRAPGDAAAAADAARRCRTGRARCRACASSTAGSASGRTAGRCRRGCTSSRARSTSPRSASARPRSPARSVTSSTRRAEARRADHRAVAAGEAALGDVVPARVLEVAARAGRGGRAASIVRPIRSARRSTARVGGVDVGLGRRARPGSSASTSAPRSVPDLDEEPVLARRGARSARGRSPTRRAGRCPSRRRSTSRRARSSSTATTNAPSRRAA